MAASAQTTDGVDRNFEGDAVLVRVIPSDPERAVTLPWRALRACRYFSEQQPELDLSSDSSSTPPELHLPLASPDDLDFVAEFLALHALVPLPALVAPIPQRARPYDVVPPRFMRIVNARAPYDLMRMSTCGFGIDGAARGLIVLLDCDALTTLIAARVSRLIYGCTPDEAHAVLQYPRPLTADERRFFASQIKWPTLNEREHERERERAEPENVRDYLDSVRDVVVEGVIQSGVLTLDCELDAACGASAGMVLAAADARAPLLTVERVISSTQLQITAAADALDSLRSRFFLWQPYEQWRRTRA